MSTVVCPDCQGAKAGFGIACSDRGCRPIERACDFCGGEGQVKVMEANCARCGRKVKSEENSPVARKDLMQQISTKIKWPRQKMGCSSPPPASTPLRQFN